MYDKTTNCIMEENAMDMPTKKGAIIVLAAIATILTFIIAVYGVIRCWNNVPIDILLCDNRGYPRTDVWFEVADLRCNPDDLGRVGIAGKYLGSTIMVFETSTGRRLLTTKLEKAGNESTITIIIPSNESEDD